MKKRVYYPEGPANAVQPIALGGTGAKTVEGAVEKLGIVTYDQANKANGALLLDNEGYIPSSQFPDGMLAATAPLLQGNNSCYTTETIVFTITNFDSFTSYDVTVNKGTASLLADKITFVAGTEPGATTMMVNGFPFTITVRNPGVQQPAIIYPINGAEDTTLSLVLQGSSFQVSGTVDTHFSSEWQVATDANFANIVLSSEDDQVNKLTIPTGRLSASQNYYARVRYIGTTTGSSPWSEPTAFVTGTGILKGQEISKIYASEPNMNDYFGSSVGINGSGDMVVVGAHSDDPSNVTDAGSTEIYQRTANGYLQRALMRAFGPMQSMALDVAQGGMVRVVADDPSNFDQYYTADTTIQIPAGAKSITMIGKGSVGIKGTDVAALNQNYTGSGSITISKGITTLTVKGKGAPAVNTGVWNWACGSDPLTVTTESDIAQYTVSPFANGWAYAAQVVKGPASSSSQSGLINFSLDHGIGTSPRYLNVNNARALAYEIINSGAATTFTINGETKTFSGGYQTEIGMIPTAPVEQTFTITLPGSADITGTYSVASGGTLNIQHTGFSGALIPVTQTISGSGTLTIPTGVTQVEVIAQGADGAINTVPLYWKKVSEAWENYTNQPVGTGVIANPGPSGTPSSLGQTIETYWWHTQGSVVWKAVYVSSNTVSATGGSSTVTLNGVTKTYPGGVGKDSVPQSNIFTLPGTAAQSLNYNIASGETASVMYIESTGGSTAPVTLNLTGTGTSAIPADIKILTLTGKGARGKTTTSSYVTGTTYKWERTGRTPTTIDNVYYYEYSNHRGAWVSFNPQYLYTPTSAGLSGADDTVISSVAFGTGTDEIGPYTIYKCSLRRIYYTSVVDIPGTTKYTTSTSYGADTKATINGTTYTFPGSYGDTDPVESVKSVTLPGVSSLTLSHVVPTGGSLKAEYGAPTITGESTFATVNGKQFTFAGGIGGLALTTTHTLLLDQEARFGKATAISKDGNHMLISADKFSNDSGTRQGTVFAYKYSAGSWVSNGILKAADGATDDLFGSSLAINSDGSFAIIGAIGDDGSVTDLGAAYLFQRTGDIWVQISKATPPSGNAQEYFGFDVAISGNGQVYAVGAKGNDSGGDSSGTVYAYVYSGGTWNVSKLMASDAAAGDSLGTAVLLSEDGNTLFAGAPGKNSSAGAIYVFTRNGINWTQTAKLTAEIPTASECFGNALAIDEVVTVLVAGAPNLGSMTVSGSVYVFSKETSTWVQRLKLLPSDQEPLNGFGGAVALSAGGDVLVVGAHNDDTIATDAGAVYIFK